MKNTAFRPQQTPIFIYRKKMAESISEILTVQKPAGIPWRLKTAELMPDAQWRMLLAILDAVVPSIQRESTAPQRKSRSIAYIPDARYQDAVSHLKKNTVLLDHASEEELGKYLSDRPTDDLLFQQVLKGMLHHVPDDLTTLLSRVLYILRYASHLSHKLSRRKLTAGCIARKPAVSFSPDMPRPSPSCH